MPLKSAAKTLVNITVSSSTHQQQYGTKQTQSLAA